MLKNLYIKSIIALSLFVLIFACSKNDPDPVHEGEVITKAKLEVSKAGSSNPTTYTFEVEGHDHNNEKEDLDEGDDDDHEGSHIEIELEANSTYNVSISFYNDSDPDKIQNITSEIIKEKDEHQIFYEITDQLSGFSITSASNDTLDSSGNPLFIETTWTTNTETSGEVVGYLIHDPTSKTGNTRNDFGGATDVEIEFEVHVK